LENECLANAVLILTSSLVHSSVSILDCLEAIQISKTLQLVGPYQEDFHFKRAQDLDFNWIVRGKIAAMSTPMPETIGILRTYLQNLTDNLGHCIQYCKENNIVAVVRLNDPVYDAQLFKAAGLAHLDLPFFDGRPPSADVMTDFLQFVVQHISKGAVAVHCRGGIGKCDPFYQSNRF
jgi:hypothetical protein